jgi:LysM repeat protein
MKAKPLLLPILLLAILPFFSVRAQFCSIQQSYIEQHHDLAILSMWRSKIPASITLAQALLESAAGQSELARQANNHFGIKCGNRWEGVTYCKLNGGATADGKRDTACYRAYPSAAASYADRERFLAHSRYDSLFRLDSKDYVGWAYGLLYCGYAECRDYPMKLIALVERYALCQYDTVTVLTAPAAPATPAVTLPRDEPLAALPPEQPVAKPRPAPQPSRAPFIIASGYETAQDIARWTGVPLGDLLVYNEDLPTGYVLPQGQLVYLDCKQQEEPVTFVLHPVQPGESMAGIAQRYRIALDRLLALNLMQPGDEPETGALLVVRGKPARYRPALKPPASAKSTASETRKTVFYTVVRGDTLWDIARRYGTTVEKIKALNGLDSKLIRRGMVLQVR